ncbi:MAG: hypothetical protein K9L17_00755 [Clostridiales bacterium]|nr:hypothetical protein [Clostridiales bacterium]MCF8021222.1 hypothetical protein [Clostridiales bacterium]
MKVKFIIIMLVILFLTGCTQVREMSQYKNSENQGRLLNPDTVITEDNVDDVLNYFEKKYNKDFKHVEAFNIDEKVTVQELEKNLKMLEKLPDKITNTHYVAPSIGTEAAVHLSKRMNYSHSDDDIDIN